MAVTEKNIVPTYMKFGILVGYGHTYIFCIENYRHGDFQDFV